MYIKKNERGRDFIVGDLHGMYDMFLQELDKVSFDEEVDRVFSVGDLIDRGPNSKECLDLLYNSWFYSVRGNHEDFFIRSENDSGYAVAHLRNGGLWTLDLTKEEKIKYLQLCKEIPLYITLECSNGTLGICHAEPPTTNWGDLDALTPTEKEAMLWQRILVYGIPKEAIPTRNVTATVHGHTIVKKPKRFVNANFIDTGAFMTHIGKEGYLTLVEAESLLRGL